MLKHVIILIGEILLIVGAVAFYRRTVNSVNDYFRKRNEAYKSEITDQIKVFLRFYNKFGRYLDKEMSHEEFIAELKLKGLINDDVISVPLGTDGFTMTVRDTFDLRHALRLLGELIYEKDDFFHKSYSVKIEQLDIYEEFSKKFQNLNLICSKHSRMEKEIVVFPNYGIIEQN